MQNIYHSLLKKENCEHKSKKFVYLHNNKFEVLIMDVSLDKAGLACDNTLEFNPTGI